MTPIAFTDFVSGVLGVTLTPGQRVLSLVAFDGIEPGRLEGRERELARELLGDVDTIPQGARHILAALCGARAGKSYVLGGLRMLHLALTVNLASMAPGEEASGPIVAPDLRLARQTLRYVTGAIGVTPSIARLVVNETQDSVTLRRPDGKTVTIECLPASRGGSAVRGRTLIAALLDEACFFRDSDFVVNDAEIYKAVAPRIVPEGQLLIVSTPWAESGLLFELFERNHGSPTDAIAAHAPTLLLRDDDHTRRLVERERERDPDNAAREFDAEPMASGTSDYFDPGAIREAICEMPLVLPPERAWDADPPVMGLDTGFRKDPSAAAIVRRTKGRIVELCETVEIRPPAGGRLVPSETLRQLLARGEYHYADRVVADGHYIETVREHAEGFELVEAPAGLGGKLEVFTAARTELHEGRLRIPSGNKRLIAQLRQVVQRPTPGGQLTITIPRRGGSHGDIVSAFVLAVWGACGDGEPVDVREQFMTWPSERR